MSNLSKRVITGSTIFAVMFFFLINILRFYYIIAAITVVVLVRALFELMKVLQKVDSKFKLFFCYIGLLVLFSASYIVIEKTMQDYQSGTKVSSILWPFLIILGTDTAGYVVGTTIGMWPMAPNISPNKTWEGFIAGLLFSILVAFVWFFIWKDSIGFELSYKNLVIISIITSLFTTFGDLFFSIIKRKAKIKNYSEIIPGHGGVLDRVDGMAFALSIWAIAMSFI